MKSKTPVRERWTSSCSLGQAHAAAATSVAPQGEAALLYGRIWDRPPPSDLLASSSGLSQHHIRIAVKKTVT
jgi:hypothetical protein